MNNLHWNFNRNSNIFIQENALEDVVCEMASICLGLNVLVPCKRTVFCNWGDFFVVLTKASLILQRRE